MGEAKRKSAGMSDYDKLLQDLTRKLTDEGKLIEAGWVGLRAMWLTADTPDFQVAELRKAFMAGAQHTYGSIMTMLDPGEAPTNADLSRMEKIDAELRAFGAELARDHYPTRGSA